MSMGSCPDFGLCWYGLCPTSGLFPSTWPSVSKGVYPKETIDFMFRQETEHLLFFKIVASIGLDPFIPLLTTLKL